MYSQTRHSGKIIPVSNLHGKYLYIAHRITGKPVIRIDNKEKIAASGLDASVYSAMLTCIRLFKISYVNPILSYPSFYKRLCLI